LTETANEWCAEGPERQLDGQATRATPCGVLPDPAGQVKYRSVEISVCPCGWMIRPRVMM